MKRCPSTPSGGPRAHLTETRCSSQAKHSLKKADTLQENKGLHGAALCLIWVVLHHSNTSAPFCVCIIIEIHTKMHAYSCIYPKGVKVAIKYAWWTPTVPTGRVPSHGNSPLPRGGATRWSWATKFLLQALCTAVHSISRVAQAAGLNMFLAYWALMLFPWPVDTGTGSGELSLRDCKTVLCNSADSPLAEDDVSPGRLGSQKWVWKIKGRTSPCPTVCGMEKPPLG